MLLPAGIAAAGDAISAAAMPDPQQLQQLSPFPADLVQGSITEAQDLARQQLARSEALAAAGTFFPELNVQGMVGNVDVPGLHPGLIGIRQGTADLINSPLGRPAPPAASVAPPPTTQVGPPTADTGAEENDILEDRRERDERRRGTFDDNEHALGDPDHPFSSAAEREDALDQIALLIESLQSGPRLENRPLA